MQQENQTLTLTSRKGEVSRNTDIPNQWQQTPVMHRRFPPGRQQVKDGHFHFTALFIPSPKPQLLKSLHSSGAEPRSIPRAGSSNRNDASLYIDLNLRSSQPVLAAHQGNEHGQLPQLGCGSGNPIFFLMGHSQAQFPNSLTLLHKVKGTSHDPAGAVTSVLPPTETAGAENSLHI